jgi:hypothetical protein
MIKMWENMAAVSRFDIVHDALIKGLDNLTKWYKKTDDSTAYFSVAAASALFRL